MTINGPAPVISPCSSPRPNGDLVESRRNSAARFRPTSQGGAGSNETCFRSSLAAVSLRHVEFTTRDCRVGIRSRSAVITSASRLHAGATGGFHVVERLCLPGMFARAESLSMSSGHVFRSSSIADSTRSSSRSRVFPPQMGDGMRDVFGASPIPAFQIAHANQRTLVDLGRIQKQSHPNGHGTVLSYINATNSCHTNGADEPFTTPARNTPARLARAIDFLEETGIFHHTMNMLAGRPA